jgi:hypothetical protein
MSTDPATLKRRQPNPPGRPGLRGLGASLGKRATVSFIVGVSIAPGQTALTRMPSWAYSIAAVRVRPMTPCLLALQGEAFGEPRSASVDATLTIAPPSPCARIAGISARIASQVPRSLMATIRSQTSMG